jgi:hypothetical protein
MPVQNYDIAVNLNVAGRLQVFAVGANSGQIYTCELSEALKQTDWLFLGGPNDTLQTAVGRNTDGSLELFALKADGHVWHTKQTGQTWDQWSDIGAIDWKSIIIGTNADGRLEVFALVDGGQVVHIWQQSPGGVWSASAFFDRTGWKAIAVGPNADGRLELFAIGADDSGYHLWQTAPNNGWTNWDHLGGVSWKEITVIPNPDGRLELFILAGGDAWHTWQIQIMGDHCQPYVDALNAAQQHLTAVLNDPDHTPADFKAAKQAVTNAENGLNQCRANPPLVGWSGSVSFGAHDLRQIGVARNADGRLELFGLGGDNSIYHIWMTAPNNGWIDQWSNFTVAAAQQFWVTSDATGRLVVLYTRDGSVNIVGQTQPNNGWRGFSSLTDPEPKPTVTLTGVPTKIKLGQSTTLSWTSEGASLLELDHGIGSVSVPNGSRSVTPTKQDAEFGSVTYTITATSRGGTAKDTQQIKVVEPSSQPSLLATLVFSTVPSLEPTTSVTLSVSGTRLEAPTPLKTGDFFKPQSITNPAVPTGSPSEFVTITIDDALNPGSWDIIYSAPGIINQHTCSGVQVPGISTYDVTGAQPTCMQGV